MHIMGSAVGGVHTLFASQVISVFPTTLKLLSLHLNLSLVPVIGHQWVSLTINTSCADSISVPLSISGIRHKLLEFGMHVGYLPDHRLFRLQVNVDTNSGWSMQETFRVD